jgi:uncharacterized protein
MLCNHLIPESGIAWYGTEVLDRKEKSMLPPPTPFPYEGPLPADEPLVDRERELAGLAERAASGRNTRVEGPRRYGKTSLLKHLIASLSEDRIGIYADLYGVVGTADVVARVERALLTAGLPRSQQLWLEARLRASSRRTVLRTGLLGVGRSETGSSAAASALEDRFAIVAELQKRASTPVIAVLDEFQAILAAGNLDALVLDEIRHHDRVGYIFAGSHLGMMRELFTERDRLSHAQATPLALGPLPLDAFAEHIDTRFAEHRRDCSRVLGALLDVGRGHPQRSMMLAAHLFARTSPGRSADEETFEDALDGAIRETSGELQGRWDAFTVSQRRALAALAHGEAPFSRAAAQRRGTTKGSTQNALRTLLASADLAQDAEGEWRIIDPFLELWTQRLDERG